ncbi:hypothetical protein SDC9_143413 [bioreactor metagenome]|uniref:Uncharacterized protein n=1 Tax=bioreactor metagenome TaxID=1076179 RepID=A0A645E410_9ZZZZ
MRNARRREREMILPRAEFADIEFFIQRFLISGGQGIRGDVLRWQERDALANRGAGTGDGHHLRAHARNRAVGIKRAVEVEVQPALEALALLQHRYFRAGTKRDSFIPDRRGFAAGCHGEHRDGCFLQPALLGNMRLRRRPIVHRCAVSTRAEHLRRIGGGGFDHGVAHGFFDGGCLRACNALVHLRKADARYLRGQHIAKVARFGDDIIISVQFAEDTDQMLALLCENGRFFFRRDEEGTNCGLDFCKARLAFSCEAACTCVFDEYIACSLRESGAHMIKRDASR